MKILFKIGIFFALISCQLQGLNIPNEGQSRAYRPFDSYRTRDLKAVDYCKFTCRDEPHVACEFKGDCSVDAPCVLGELDKKQMVDIHNKLRNNFALGKDPKAQGLTVANMVALQWDDELATLAGCNLKKCADEMKHDQCHITDTFKNAGQNLAWSKGIDDCVKYSEKAIQDWYDEIKQLNVAQIKGFGKGYQSISGTGHFTQVAWATSTHIGCATTTKKAEDGTICLTCCNYGPAGNFLGKSMFKEGKPASACPDGLSPNGKLKGLCGGGGANSISVEITVLLVPLFFQLLFYV